MIANDNFVPIKAGTFMMGAWHDSYNVEKPLHRVTIKNDFYICQYQVTMAEYLSFVSDTCSHYPEWSKKGDRFNLDDNRYKDQNFEYNAPIIGINWQDAKAYCAWRSQKEDKNYRLPTEAEWEYACRAGTTTMYSFSDDEAQLKEYAWYKDNSKEKMNIWSLGKRKARIVGKKKPNPWGLYDMYGNVGEWCEDEWSYSYETTPRDGSAQYDRYGYNSAFSHVVRGGSYHKDSYDCSSSYRYHRSQGGVDIGFRVVLDEILL